MKTGDSEVEERRLAAILATDMVGFSRLMEQDEAGTFSRQRAYRSELIDPQIDLNHGRIVKTTGDGILAEFVSVLDAMRCAIGIQESILAREANSPDETRIQFRMGINLGDVMVEDGDIFGDGVNVASRLESLSEPGGICVSDAVHRSIANNVDGEFEFLGEQSVKNITRPVTAWQWRPTGRGEVDVDDRLRWHPDDQEIRFTTSDDGVQIAYATVGEGPPLVKAPNWMNHLEYDWHSPLWRHLMQELARDRTLIRFDQRGNGLSDRSVESISLESYVQDLECVVEAVGLDTFPLLGLSQGCAISIAYTVRNPGRVKGLILYGGFARGGRKRGTEGDQEKADAFATMMRHGWEQDDPRFRQLFTSAFMPDATPDQANWFNELQRVSVAPEMAARIRDTNENIDITELLPQVDVPTLVMHVRDDFTIPFDEGRRMASLIPNARFVPLEGRNHLMLEDEPAWGRFVSEVRGFLAEIDP